MQSHHEETLRSLLGQYGVHEAGGMAELINRLSQVLAGKDFCVRAHEDIAKQSIPPDGFSAESAIEYLVKTLPAGQEISVRSELPLDLAISLASIISFLRSGYEIADECARHNDFQDRIDDLEMEVTALKSQNASLIKCSDHRRQMIEYVTKRLEDEYKPLALWASDFIREQIRGLNIKSKSNAHNPLPRYEKLDDCSRLMDYVTRTIFLRSKDQPNLSVMLQAVSSYSPVAFVFLGPVPEGIEQLSDIDINIFEMSVDAEVPGSALVGRKIQSDSGVCWVFDRILPF